MKINLFAICKNDRFIHLMESLYNSENIFISGICKTLSLGLIQFSNSFPKPDIVVLDAYWPQEGSKDLLLRLLEMDVKVIIVTNFQDLKVLDYFSPILPNGYYYRDCDDYKIITNCIKQVFYGKTCYSLT